MYLTNQGLVGMSLNDTSHHSLLPVSSQPGGIDFDFDSQLGEVLMVRKGILGNVSRFISW